MLASVSSIGSIDSPCLEVELQGSEVSLDLANQSISAVAWLLGTDQDLSPFYQLARQDPTMSAITKRFRGLHVPHTATVFEALVLGILGQQIATNVARIIRTLLIETYGPKGSLGGEVFYAFPRPESLATVSVEELRGLKLSQRKAEYVQGVALSALGVSGRNLERLRELDDIEVVKEVTALRGLSLIHI